MRRKVYSFPGEGAWAEAPQGSWYFTSFLDKIL